MRYQSLIFRGKSEAPDKLLLTDIPLVAIIGIFIFPRLIKAKSYLSVQVTHPASIYVDNKFVGKAPLVVPVAKNEVSLRLVPDDINLSGFEERILVAKNTTSKVSVYFSSDPSLSSYVVSYLEKIGSNDVEISVVSMPNLARLKLDGQVRGFTPVKLVTTLGKHNLETVFDGYFPQSFEIETKEGYRVISIVKLAKNQNFIQQPPVQEAPIEKKEAETPAKEYIEVQDTSTGFLRVRQEANTASAEIGQVRPGETYELIEKDTLGWYKIQLTEAKSGWISSQYAKIVDSKEN